MKLYDSVAQLPSVIRAMALTVCIPPAKVVHDDMLGKSVVTLFPDGRAVACNGDACVIVKLGYFEGLIERPLSIPSAGLLAMPEDRMMEITVEKDAGTKGHDKVLLHCDNAVADFNYVPTKLPPWEGMIPDLGNLDARVMPATAMKQMMDYVMLHISYATDRGCDEFEIAAMPIFLRHDAERGIGYIVSGMTDMLYSFKLHLTNIDSNAVAVHYKKNFPLPETDRHADSDRHLD